MSHTLVDNTLQQTLPTEQANPAARLLALIVEHRRRLALMSESVVRFVSRLRSSRRRVPSPPRREHVNLERDTILVRTYVQAL
jgi:hypothetical protein